MPHYSQSTTITPSTSKLDYIEALKEAVGPEGLRTLRPDEAKPPRIRRSAAITSHLHRCCACARRSAALGKGPAQTVNFAAFSNGYPRPGLALLAANALNDAAQEWNKLDLGIKFKWVEKIEDASFVLSYAGNQGDVLAEAFFPNEDDLSYLNVYLAAFQPGTVQCLKNIFLHELGHVLGFRHEFAAELEKEEESVQLGPRNPLSVMGYEFPPQIQTTDVESEKAFYKFPGASLGWQEARIPSSSKRKPMPIKDCAAR
ncbi:hypothetical protein BDW68DRAFT_177374 [Aspergillus falconensis]